MTRDSATVWSVPVLGHSKVRWLLRPGPVHSGTARFDKSPVREEQAVLT